MRSTAYLVEMLLGTSENFPQHGIRSQYKNIRKTINNITKTK
jgi:hypothetical protein